MQLFRHAQYPVVYVVLGSIITFFTAEAEGDTVPSGLWKALRTSAVWIGSVCFVALFLECFVIARRYWEKSVRERLFAEWQEHWRGRGVLDADGNLRGVESGDEGHPADNGPAPGSLNDWRFGNGERVRARRSPAMMLEEDWDLPHPIATEIGNLIDLIVRDFVDYWYLPTPNQSGGPPSGGISEDPEFRQAIVQCLVTALGRLSTGIGSAPLLVFLLDDAIEALRVHVEQLDAMETEATRRFPDFFGAIDTKRTMDRAQRKPLAPIAEAVRMDPEGRQEGDVAGGGEEMQELRRLRAILGEFRHRGKLHPAARRAVRGHPKAHEEGLPGVGSDAAAERSWTDAFQTYSRSIGAQVLARTLPSHERQSGVMGLLLREVLGSVALPPALQALTPELLNWIILWALSLHSEAEPVAPRSHVNGPAKEPREPSLSVAPSSSSVAQTASSVTQTSSSVAQTSSVTPTSSVAPEDAFSEHDSAAAAAAGPQGEEQEVAAPASRLARLRLSAEPQSHGSSPVESPASVLETASTSVTDRQGSLVTRRLGKWGNFLLWDADEAIVAAALQGRGVGSFVLWTPEVYPQDEQKLGWPQPLVLTALVQAPAAVLAPAVKASRPQNEEPVCVWASQPVIVPRLTRRHTMPESSKAPSVESATAHISRTNTSPLAAGSFPGARQEGAVVVAFLHARLSRSRNTTSARGVTWRIHQDAVAIADAVASGSAAAERSRTVGGSSSPLSPSSAFQMEFDSLAALVGSIRSLLRRGVGVPAPTPSRPPLDRQESSSDESGKLWSDEDVESGNAGSDEDEDDEEEDDVGALVHTQSGKERLAKVQPMSGQVNLTSLFAKSSVQLIDDGNAVAGAVLPQPPKPKRKSGAFRSRAKSGGSAGGARRSRRISRHVGVKAARSIGTMLQHDMERASRRCEPATQGRASMDGMHQDGSSDDHRESMQSQEETSAPAVVEEGEGEGGGSEHEPPSYIMPFDLTMEHAFHTLVLASRLIPVADQLAAAWAQRPPPAKLKEWGVLFPRRPQLSAHVGGVQVDNDCTDKGDPRPVARFAIHVTCGCQYWLVWARYSEFHAVDSLLRDQCRTFPPRLPPKSSHRRLLGGTLSTDFLNSRGADLRQWLADCMSLPHVRGSHEMRAFLAPRRRGDVRSRKGAQVDGSAAGAEDSHEGACSTVSLIGPGQAAADVVIEAADRGWTLHRGDGLSVPREAASASLGAFPRGADEKEEQETDDEEDAKTGAMRGYRRTLVRGDSPKKSRFSRRWRLWQARAARMVRRDPETILQPSEFARAERAVFHLVEALFDLSKRGWLRRHMVSAVRSIASVLYHGSMSQFLHDMYLRETSAPRLGEYLSLVRELLWPGGTFLEAGPSYSERQAWRLREESLCHLARALPPSVVSLVGRHASNLAVHKLHSLLQCPLLVRSLLFTLVDLLLLRIFPDMAVSGLSWAQDDAPLPPWERPARARQKKQKQQEKQQQRGRGNRQEGAGGVDASCVAPPNAGAGADPQWQTVADFLGDPVSGDNGDSHDEAEVEEVCSQEPAGVPVRLQHATSFREKMKDLARLGRRPSQPGKRGAASEPSAADAEEKPATNRRSRLQVPRTLLGLRPRRRPFRHPGKPA